MKVSNVHHRFHGSTWCRGKVIKQRFDSHLSAAFKVNQNLLEEIIQHFGKHTHLLSSGELDKKIDVSPFNIRLQPQA